MKGWIAVVTALLLIVPGVSAFFSIYGEPPALTSTTCRTNLDCITLARKTLVQCTPGYTTNPSPQCERNGCTFCVPAQNRPRIQCRIDTDCASTKCAQGLFVRCIGRSCLCRSQQRPECYTDNDCTRPLYLQRKYQRMVCQRGKCIAPSAPFTMLPRYTVPARILPRY